MTDIDIIRLLWIRDEIAIEELEAFRKTDQIRFEHMSQGSQEIYRLTR